MKATAIKERPILMSGPMVRAILRAENPKTQTRRVLLPTDIPAATRSLRWENQTAEELLHVAHCKYGQPGDRLWVREAFYVDTTPVGQLPVTPTRDDIDNTYYRANSGLSNRSIAPILSMLARRKFYEMRQSTPEEEGLAQIRRRPNAF